MRAADDDLGPSTIRSRRRAVAGLDVENESIAAYDCDHIAHIGSAVARAVQISPEIRTGRMDSRWKPPSPPFRSALCPDLLAVAPHPVVPEEHLAGEEHQAGNEADEVQGDGGRGAKEDERDDEEHR